MTTALKRYPRRIDPRRSARNTHVPQATYMGRLLHAQNHIVAYRRKAIFSWGDWDNRVTGATGTVNRFRFYCHTGYGATHLTARIGLGLADNASAVDPTVSMIVTPSGGAALPTQSVHYGFGEGTPDDSPDERTEFLIRVPVSANTTYEGVIQQIDFARILDVCVYEEASPYVDPAVDHYVDISEGAVGFPVYDSTRESIVRGLSEMWRKNGSHLYSYPGPETGTLSPGTTWTNYFDLTTSVSSSSTKVYLGNGFAEAMCRLSDGMTLDVVLAVYGQAIGGNTGEVRFQDAGGTLCSITGITTTLGWHTTTTTISAIDERGEMDLQVRNSNGAHSISVHAVSLFSKL